MQNLQHTRQEIGFDKIVRDGDFDAVKTKKFAAVANTDYVFAHNLGRIAWDITVRWSDAFVSFKVVKDSQNRPQQDKEKTVLQFDAPATVIIRFA